jgi:hypothetical protein
MVAQIHTLRNRLAAARLTASAMIDGKLPSDKGNLQALAHLLDEVDALVASVPKYDLEDGVASERVVDVQEMIEAVAAEVALVAAAVNVALVVVKPPRVEIGCRVLRGRTNAIHETLERALRGLLMALPEGAEIVIAPRSADVVGFTVATPGSGLEETTVRLPGERVCEFRSPPPRPD